MLNLIYDIWWLNKKCNGLKTVDAIMSDSEILWAL